MLDADDRITHVSPHLHHDLGSWLGHVLWDHLPGAREVYGPCFDEARSSGQPVESVVFYSGRVKRLTVIPAADGLAVHVERLAELDVTSLGTLTRSLAADRGRASWSSVRATRSTSGAGLRELFPECRQLDRVRGRRIGGANEVADGRLGDLGNPA